MRRESLLLALVLALSTPAPLLGQGPLRATFAPQEVEGPAFDYFLSRYQSPQGSADDAVGGRLLWSLAPLARPHSAWLTRAYLGGYYARSARDGEGSMRWRYGAQADVLIPEASLSPRVVPFISLGVGATRETEVLRAPPMVRSAGVANPTLKTARTSASIGPGVGIRVHLGPGIALRGDAREIVDLGSDPRRNLEFSGGVSFGV